MKDDAPKPKDENRAAPPPSIGPRLEAWAKRNPLLIGLGLIIMVGTSLNTLVDWSLTGTQAFIELSKNPRSQEYDLVNSLRPGMHGGVYEEWLGAPLFLRRSDDRTMTEKTFQRPGYWVQVVEDEDSIVVWVAVTSCERGFRPTFTLGYSLKQWELTLSESSFAAAAPSFTHAESYYQLPGATERHGHWDVFGGDNATAYLEHVVGISEACPSTMFAPFLLLLAQDDMGTYMGSAHNPVIQGFRDRAIVNTYGYGGDVATIRRTFGFGPPVALVRRTQGPDVPEMAPWPWAYR